MAVNSLSTLHGARALAQELYTRCRDSTSSYKALTTTIRKLRNHLEEIEEVFDDTRTLSPLDLKLLAKVSQSRDILTRLDVALKSYQSSQHKDVDESIIDDFRTALDVTTKAISIGESPLPLDTDTTTDSAVVDDLASMQWHSASLAAAETSHERRSSQTSSGWSLVDNSSPSLGSTSDGLKSPSKAGTERRTSAEKEIYDLASTQLHKLPSFEALLPDWRSPFAYPDPLSSNIEEASNIILASEDGLIVTHARSTSLTGSVERSIWGSVPEKDKSFVEAVPDDVAAPKHLSKLEASELEASEPVLIPTGQPLQALRTSPSAQPKPTESKFSRRRMSTRRLEQVYPADKLSVEGEKDSINSEPQNTKEANECSPKPASTEQVARGHSDSVASTKDSLDAVEESTEAPESQEPLNERIAEGHDRVLEALSSNVETVHNDSNDRRVDRLLPSQPPLNPEDEQCVPKVGQKGASLAPQMPTRRPPAPPPRRSRPKVPSPSTYVIVNGSPTSDESSGDELYTSSRPASPKLWVQSSPKDVPELNIPPMPPRPSQARYRSKPAGGWPAATTSYTTPSARIKSKPAATEGKEFTPGTGLEGKARFEDELEVGKELTMKARSPDLSERTGEDKALAMAEVRQECSIDWYGPRGDTTTSMELDTERVRHIVHFWNTSSWDQAEAYLTPYLESLIEQDDLARARRVRHLLGVCASFKGQWALAIQLFLAVLRTPIHDLSEIDDGDCAAAYWLGDIYALLNKRTEALLAYCIAERCSLFHDLSEPYLGECISAEQEAVQLGVPKGDFKAHCARKTLSGDDAAAGTILDSNVVTTSAAKMLLDKEPRQARKESNYASQFKTSRSRGDCLFYLSKVLQVGRFHRMRVTAEHFTPDTAWPLMYDPLFCAANVQRGRLSEDECDMLAVLNSNTDAKIPRSGPMGLSKMDCFTCGDLTWLVTAIRECLNKLRMGFSEIVNTEGVWWTANYTATQHRIATTYYFSIALFKQSFRSCYGVEIAPDGICSARILRRDHHYQEGVHFSESKRVKKLVRDYLDENAKQNPRLSKKGSFLEGSWKPERSDPTPSLPPRPRP